MQSPAAMFIESAAETIQHGKHAGGLKWLQESQLKELRSAVPNPGTFEDGYVLGLETARVIIMASMAVRLKGVNPEDVL